MGGGGCEGSLRNPSKNSLKWGAVDKGKSCSWGEGSTECVTTPALLPR